MTDTCITCGRPLAATTRTNDPDTSGQQAKPRLIKVGSQHHRLLRQYGNTVLGLSDRTCARLVQMDAPGVCFWKRCSELRQFHLVAPTGRTATDHVTGREVRLCAITEHGRRTLERLEAGQPVKVRQPNE